MPTGTTSSSGLAP